MFNLGPCTAAQEAKAPSGDVGVAEALTRTGPCGQAFVDKEEPERVSGHMNFDDEL